jgi:hypothetical protein
MALALTAPLVSIDWSEDEEAPVAVRTPDEPESDNIITH